eukprot:CAMPEP_0194260742 /NCGR_PEP_ID=MMETSP0158-20130606/45669_1 /TAXON_ID=33649 /ORGANISM="Thalassionema nitzschioides, Strain L26-B" /LENGTH=458 /DNA_ID=CAMNT_0039000843 /DNA_START=188 /DNA_END=1561 /DNA_ORIENTATION=-
MSWTRSLLFFLATLSSTVQGQTGDLPCVCSPTTFTFKLNFDTVCPGTVDKNEGISGIECFGIPIDTDDIVPVKAELIQVIESNIGLQNIAIRDYDGPFFDGEEVTYASVSTGDLTRPDEVPGSIQINLRLRNAEDAIILYAFTARYTNNCDFTPVFEEGDVLGPIILSSFSPARPKYCPAVPTIFPVSSPPSSAAPVSDPPVSDPPVSDPPVEPTDEPSLAPTTVAPTTVEPTTEAPTTAEPTTAEPTTAEPTTAEPTTAEPTTAEPTTEEPTTEEPTTAEPTTRAPSDESTPTGEPTTSQPTTEAPTTVEPTTEAPTTVEPTTEAPTTVEPTTAEPTTIAPTDPIPPVGPTSVPTRPPTRSPTIAPIIPTFETFNPTLFPSMSMSTYAPIPSNKKSKKSKKSSDSKKSKKESKDGDGDSDDEHDDINGKKGNKKDKDEKKGGKKKRGNDDYDRRRLW